MAIVNTYFQKREDHIVTYRSGKHFSQTDYLLIRRKDLWRIKDCKVISGEEIAKNIVHLSWILKEKGFRKGERFMNLELGAWKLERNVDENWETLTADIKETAIHILGQTKGGKALNRELFGGINRLGISSKERKKILYRRWHKSKKSEDYQEYREAKRAAKKAVVIAKNAAYTEMANKLDQKGGDRLMYKLTKIREKKCRDVGVLKIVKNEEGQTLFKP
ncbi:uncharacterized protein LOC135928800 [Gordionus sp. m RMFG-2023]|uniref:uncharacterized protein LOC135928800 n=1 Tax=Gordionus sp. m RMFG-2023 TaxID=3053472 RepID=UPI0031FDA6EF